VDYDARKRKLKESHCHMGTFSTSARVAASGATGESDLVAAIVPTREKAPNIKGIFDLCLKDLERNSVPSYIQVVKEIPKTGSEKNLDRLLREEFRPEADGVYKIEDYNS
jgi:acyl-CoA synthetase (AMP-forming)/AMP-acid ligase II